MKLKICCNLQVISNLCAKYEHPPSKNERGVLFSRNKIDFHLNIWHCPLIPRSYLYCKLHMIGNHFADYEHPRSKNKREIRVTDRIQALLNVTLTFDSNVILVI